MTFPYIEIFEEFFSRHFNSKEFSQPHFKILLDSIRYSLQSGGKRFRPNLIFLLSEALELDYTRVIPFAAAIECIHTYSLIHDDLPSLDNDYWRRNRPTNHILFGEATALLAGDALLTESFQIISRYYHNLPEVGLELVNIISKASGISGMIGGQIMDIKAKTTLASKDETILIHKLKTGALISSCCQGVACIASSNYKFQLKEFGDHLGFAFQLKDDFLDFDPKKPEPCNLVSSLGEDPAKKILTEISLKAESALREVNLLTNNLKSLISFNLQRSL
jgi:geranylgeranyl diphosphate synthase type II